MAEHYEVTETADLAGCLPGQTHMDYSLQQYYRDQNTLTVVGMGTAAFGAWNLLRIVLLLCAQPEKLAAWLDIDLHAPYARFSMSLVLLFFMTLFLGFRLYIALGAIREASGRKAGFFYLVLSACFIFVFTAGLISQAIHFRTFFENRENVIASILMDLISLITLIQLFLSAIRIRRARRAMRIQEEAPRAKAG